MTETPTKRMIPALPATIEGVRVTWRRWTPAPLLSHVDPRCPTCAYDGGSVLAFGLAGEPPVIRFSAHRCPACDEMTIYERVPQQSPPPFVRSREVAYSPPRTEEPNMSDVEPRPDVPEVRGLTCLTQEQGIPHARPEVLDELVGLAVRANANRSHADLCGCATWPERCASGYIPGEWEHGDEAHTIAAVLPAHERLVRKRVADETRRLARRWAANAQATPAGAERERRFAVANVLTEHADSIERGGGPVSTPTPDRCGVTTVMDGKTITCVLPPGHDDTLHQGPDGGWWLGDDSLPSVPQPSPTAGSNDGEERFEGHDSRECGEHRTTGPRAWCSNCQEWCYPGILCRGCELPLLRQRAEQAEAALQRVRNLAASLHDGVLARRFLAALDQPEEAPTGQERAAPVDWEAIALQRERELKEAGEARHRAEAALRDLTDPRPCDPHPGNGYCQTHGETPPCPHAAAEEILDRTEETP